MDQRDWRELDDHDATSLIGHEDGKTARAMQPPRAPIIYATISAHGIHELNRPLLSLVASGIAAGIILMTSVLAQSFLHGELPPFPGREVVSDMGYTVGFLIVILCRLQLFTENTITPVLPILAKPSRLSVLRLSRLWGVVLSANLVGTFIAAVSFVHVGIISAEQLVWVREISAKLLDHSPLEALVLAIPAGFLIAALVWCISTARGAEFWIIFLITYVIALGNFTHVVAGSGEAFVLWLTGEASFGQVWGVVIGPALIGNVIGGTLLFAMLAYGQVREELCDRDSEAPRSP